MATRVVVEGLNETKENFNKLDDLVQRQIGRASLADQGEVLATPMRANTYTTFIRRTGSIQHSIGLVVAREPHNAGLVAYIKVLPRAKLDPFGALVRKQRSRDGVPFYWRFLELGTNPRTSERTPAFLRTGKIGRTRKVQLRQLAQVRTWASASSRGAVDPRPWLGPVFGQSAQTSIGTFRETILKLIDAAVSDMPKPKH